MAKGAVKAKGAIKGSRPGPTKGARTGTRDPQILAADPTSGVDELPPEGRSTSERSTRYAKAMAEVRALGVTGKWFPLARFAGRGGARQVQRALEAGERPVDGDVSEWDFASRRTDDGGSTLWVMLK